MLSPFIVPIPMFEYCACFVQESQAADPSWKIPLSYRVRAVLYYADSLILPIVQDFQRLGRVKHMGYGIERDATEQADKHINEDARDADAFLF